MKKVKQPRKYTSDTYFQSRVGKFLLGRVDYNELVTEIDYQRLADEGLRQASTREMKLLIPRGNERLQGLEFVFEVLSWRERRLIEGGFVPKYSMRAMWDCADIYQRLQICQGKEKPTIWLRRENCIVVRELGHGEALTLSAELAKRYTRTFWPRRILHMGE